MQTKEHSLCFTGHRSEKLSKTEQEMEHLKQKLLAEIDNAIENGIDTFYIGACYGFDLLAAQMVLRRKKVISLNEPRQKPLKLVAVIPFEEQASRWSEKDRELYFDYTLPYCDEVVTLNTHYKQGCYHERNRYMVDRCTKTITGELGNTGGTIQFKEHGSYTLTASITDTLGKMTSVSKSVVVYPVAEVKLKLPNISHTDKTVTLQTESKNAEGLTAHWALTKDGAPVELESQIEGNVSLADSNIRFKEKGVYQLTVTLTDKTGRAFTDTTKITVYPVGAVGFYLPSILHTDEIVKVETTLTEIGNKTAAWTVTKDGKEIEGITGTLTNEGGNIRFKDKGQYRISFFFLGSLYE